VTITAALTLTTTQAALLRPIVRLQVSILEELHHAQVQILPPGDDSWADTAEELEQLRGALMQLEGIR
jgi:hypothetical protein